MITIKFCVVFVTCNLHFMRYSALAKTNFPLRYTIYYLWLLDFLIAHSCSVCSGLGGWNFGQVSRSLAMTVKIPMERQALFLSFV